MVSTAKKFIESLERSNFAYQHNPDTNDVYILFHGCENIPRLRMLFSFAEDCKSVIVYEFDLVKYTPDKLADVMFAINRLNNGLNYIKLSIWPESNGVVAQMHALFDDEGRDVLIQCLDLMELFIKQCDRAYPELLKAVQ